MNAGASTLNVAALAALERAINAALGMDAATREQVGALAGSVFCIDCSVPAVRAYVASHTNAIGYASLIGETGASADVKTLALEGVVPELATLQAAGYHLTRTIYLLAHAPVKPSVQPFWEFAQRMKAE